MKNRLEIARELLSDEGAICVQISDDGVGELHVLLKDIFNKSNNNNFINKITIKTKSPSGFASVNPGVFETAEYVLMYAKNKKKWQYNPQFVATGYDANYKWIVLNKNEAHTKWIIEDLFEHVAKLNGYKSKKEAEKKIHKSVFLQIVSEFAVDNADIVFRPTEINDDAGKETVQARELSKNNKDVISKVSRDGKYDVYILNGREIAFYSKKIRLLDGEKVPSMQLSNIWTDVPYEGIAKEGDVTLKGGKKPEKLMRRIIDIASNAGDLVLDYHIGSGTTCGVAHKSGRQYIGVEQLDYEENDSVVRLKNVINGDQSGVSKALDWKGGGDFVYMELAKWNELWAEKIEKAKTAKELINIWNEIKAETFLSYKVDPKNIDANAKDFAALNITDQKKYLMECLDKNHLYVNFSEMNDKDYGVSKEDKALNKDFYGR
jgi:adenine-specific DNA-methyltransferase